MPVAVRMTWMTCVNELTYQLLGCLPIVLLLHAARLFLSEFFVAKSTIHKTGCPNFSGLQITHTYLIWAQYLSYLRVCLVAFCTSGKSVLVMYIDARLFLHGVGEQDGVRFIYHSWYGSFNHFVRYWLSIKPETETSNSLITSMASL